MIAQRVDKFRSTIIVLVVAISAVIFAGTMAPALGMTGPAAEGAQLPSSPSSSTPVEPASTAAPSVLPAAVSTPPPPEPTLPEEGPEGQPMPQSTSPPPEEPGEEEEEESTGEDTGGVTEDTVSASPLSQGTDAVRGSANETLFGACNYLMYCRWAAAVGTPTPTSSLTNAINITNSGAAIIGLILFALTGIAYLVMGILLQIALSVDIVSKGIFISDYIFAHLISGSVMSDQGDVADAALISSGQVMLGTILVVMFIMYAVQFGVIPTKSFSWGPFAAMMATRRLIMSLVLSLVLFGLVLIMSYAAQRNHPEFDPANPAPIAETVGTVDDLSALGISARGAFGDNRIEAISEPSNWAVMSPGWVSAWTSKILYSVGGMLIAPVNGLSQTMTAISDRDSIGTCTYYTDAMHEVFRATPAAKSMGGRGEILVTYDVMVRNLHFNNYRMAFGSSTTSSSNSWCRAAESQAESSISDQLMIARTAGLYKEMIGSGGVGVPTLRGVPDEASGGILVDAEGNWTSTDAQLIAGSIFGPYFESQDTLNRSSMYFAVCQWTPGSNVSINPEWHGVQWYDTGDQSNAAGNLANRVLPFNITELGQMPEFDISDPNKSCIEGITDKGMDPDEDGWKGWFTSDGFEGPGRFGYLDGLGGDKEESFIGAIGTAFGFSNGQYQPFFVKDNGERAYDALNYVSAVNGMKGPATMFLSVMSVAVAFLTFRFFGPLIVPVVLGNMAFVLALSVIWVALFLAMFPVRRLRAGSKEILLTMLAGQIVSSLAAFLIAAVLLATSIAQLLIAGFIPIGGNPWLRSIQYAAATILGFWSIMWLIKNSGFLRSRGLNEVGTMAGGMAIGKTAFAPVVNTMNGFRGDKNEATKMKTPWSRDFWWGEKKEKEQNEDLLSDSSMGIQATTDGKGAHSIGGHQRSLDQTKPKGLLGRFRGGKGDGGEDPTASLVANPKNPKGPKGPKGAAALVPGKGDKAGMRTNPTTGQREYLDPKTGLWKPADTLFDKDKKGDSLRDKDGNPIPLRSNPATGKREFLDPSTKEWKPLDSLSDKQRENLAKGKLSPSVRFNPKTGKKEYLDTKTGEWLNAAKMAERDLDRKSLPGLGSKRLKGQWKDHERSGKLAQSIAPVAAKVPAVGPAGAATLKGGGVALEQIGKGMPKFIDDSVIKAYELRASRLGNMPPAVQEGAAKALEFGERADALDPSTEKGHRVAGALSSSLTDESNAQAMNLASNTLPIGAVNDVNPGNLPSSLIIPEGISTVEGLPSTVMGNNGERLVDVDTPDLGDNAQAGTFTVGALSSEGGRTTFDDPISRAGTISSLGMSDPNLSSFVNEQGDPVTSARLSESLADSGNLGSIGSGMQYDPTDLDTMRAWADGRASSQSLFTPNEGGDNTIHVPGPDGAQQSFSPAVRRYMVDESGDLGVTEITGTQVGDFNSEQVAQARAHLANSMEDLQRQAEDISSTRAQALASMWNKVMGQARDISSREEVGEAFSVLARETGRRPTVKAEPERVSAPAPALQGEVHAPAPRRMDGIVQSNDMGRGFKDTARNLASDPQVRKMAASVSKKAALSALKMMRKK